MKRKRWIRTPTSWIGTVLMTLTTGLGMPTWSRAQPEPSSSLGAAVDIVAVLPFEQVGASAAEAAAATERLLDELLKSGRFVIVNRAEIDTERTPSSKLWSQGPRRDLLQSDCTQTWRALTTSRRLRVRKWICGTVSRLDDTHWVVAAKLVDLETAQTLRAPSVQHEGAFFDLLRIGIPSLAQRLTEPDSSAELALQSAIQVKFPRSGWAAFGGLRNRSGTLKSKQAGNLNYDTTGPQIGGGYQWALSPRWSAEFLLAGGSGSVSGAMKEFYQDSGGGMFGAQLRFWWPGGGYLGGEIGNYTTKFSTSVSKSNLRDLTLEGIGVGIVAGFEWPNGGFVDLTWSYESLVAQHHVTTAFLDGDASEQMLRLSLGYRW
jgi:hypothetical protein